MVKKTVLCHFLFIFAASFEFSQVQGGGYKNHLCPPEKAAHDCNEGCSFDHGALYGFCVNNTLFPNDFNCYCGPILPGNKRNDKSGQCLDALNPKYEEACRVSCQCSHGTRNGRCNYETRGCECFTQVPNPQAENNGICKYETIEEFLGYLKSLNLPNWPRP